MSQTPTARATSDAIRAAGRSTTARTGVLAALADGGAPSPDPFRIPAPEDIGWDVTGGIACDLRVALHGDPRGRSVWIWIAPFASPQTNPQMNLRAEASTDTQALAAATTGTFATAALFAAAWVAQFNALLSPAAQVARASWFESDDGSAVIQVRGLRDPDALGSQVGANAYGVFSLTDDAPLGSATLTTVWYREVYETAFVDVYTRPAFAPGAAFRPIGPAQQAVDGWVLAASYGEQPTGGLDERLNVASRRAVWPRVFGGAFTGDSVASLAAGTTLHDVAWIVVAPSDEASR